MYSEGSDGEAGHRISVKSSDNLKARSREGSNKGLVIGFLECLLRGSRLGLETQSPCGSRREYIRRSTFCRICKEQKVSFCRHTAPLTSEIFLQWMQNVALTRKTIHMAVENRRKKLQSARRGAGGSGGLEGIIFLHIPDLTPLLFSLTLRLSFAFMSVCDPLPPHTHFNLRLYWGPGVSWTN